MTATQIPGERGVGGGVGEGAGGGAVEGDEVFVGGGGDGGEGVAGGVGLVVVPLETRWVMSRFR